MKRAAINTSVFLTVLYAGLLLTAFLPKKTFSEQEKRYLSEKPELTRESVLSGRFMDEAELWLTDHMPFREAFRSLYAGTSYAAGRRRIEGIYTATDGFLMEVLSKEELSGSLFRTNVEALSSFVTEVKEAGIAVYIMPVPPSGAMQSAKLPALVPMYDLTGARQYFTEQVGEAYLDLTTVLTEETDYYRTDHHWSAEGAYKAYAFWQEKRGIACMPIESLSRALVSEGFFGTFYAKAPLPWIKGDKVYAYSALSETGKLTVTADGRNLSGLFDETKLGSRNDAYTYFLGGNYGKLLIRRESASGGKLLVIKDSFANCFLPYASMDFNEVHAIDLRYFNGSVQEYIRENGITEVLCLFGFNEFARDRNIWKLEEE